MSEFGTGYAYCLGLFLCHDERRLHYKNDYPADGRGAEMWFHGASDHLFEMEIPGFLPENQKTVSENFKDLCLRWHMTMGEVPKPTWDDVKWAIQTAKDLLRMLDEHLGVKSEKGDWE